MMYTADKNHFLKSYVKVCVIYKILIYFEMSSKADNENVLMNKSMSNFDILFCLVLF